MENEYAHRPGCRVTCLLIELLRDSLSRCDHEQQLYQDLHFSPPGYLPDRFATDETPLQMAYRVGDLAKLLEEKDGSLMELMVLTPGPETPLNLAARNGHLEVVRALLDHARQKSYCKQFINVRNCHGEVNGGCTVLDILDSVSETGEVKDEIEKVLQRAGGVKGNAKKELKDRSNQDVLIKVDEHFRHRPAPAKAHRTRPSVGGAHVALLLATMFATMAFHSALRIDSLSARVVDHQLSLTILERRIEAVMLPRVFVLFNSMAFFSSLGLITILLHHLPPIRPWLLILVATFSGAYICTVMASTSADETTTVALLGASVLTAAMMNCLAFKFNKVVLDGLRWICKRYPVIRLDWIRRTSSYSLLQEVS